MEKLSIPGSANYLSLPLLKLDDVRYSVYVLDLHWNYLFANKFVSENLGERGKMLKGKNMWDTFPELLRDPAFRTLKQRSEQGLETNMLAFSPITSQKLYITGRPLQDCYLFTSSIVPKKEEVIDELKAKLNERKRVLFSDRT